MGKQVRSFALSGVANTKPFSNGQSVSISWTVKDITKELDSIPQTLAAKDSTHHFSKACLAPTSCTFSKVIVSDLAIEIATCHLGTNS
jgi:hypothetical protein